MPTGDTAMSGRRANDVCTECKWKLEVMQYPLCEKCKRPFCQNCMHNHECKILLYKMVFLVRKDLNMSPGKIAAQVGHAAVDLVLTRHTFYGSHFDHIDEWHKEGGRKVVLG